MPQALEENSRLFLSFFFCELGFRFSSAANSKIYQFEDKKKGYVEGNNKGSEKIILNWLQEFWNLK